MSEAGGPGVREWPAVVWMGDRLLVWGGVDDGDCKPWSCSLRDGALHDPVARRWRPAPTCGYPHDLRPEHAFWTGSEVVVVSGVTPGVAKLGGL